MLQEFHQDDDFETRDLKTKAFAVWYGHYETLSRAKDIVDLDKLKQTLLQQATYDHEAFAINYFYDRIIKQFNRGFGADTDGDIRGLITKFVHEYRNK